MYKKSVIAGKAVENISTIALSTNDNIIPFLKSMAIFLKKNVVQSQYKSIVYIKQSKVNKIVYLLVIIIILKRILKKYISIENRKKHSHKVYSLQLCFFMLVIQFIIIQTQA